MSDSSFSEEFHETFPDFQNYRDPNTYQYYSDDNSQNHTNPPSDFLNQSLYGYSHHWRTVSASPGRRLGLSPDTRASVAPQPNCYNEPNTNLDLNLPPRPLSPPVIPQERATTPGPIENQPPSHIPPTNQQTSQFAMLLHLSISNWAQRSYRIINNFCVPVGPAHSPSPSLPLLVIHVRVSGL